jgi:hypothetical protein
MFFGGENSPFFYLKKKKEVAQPTWSRGTFLKIATFPGILFLKLPKKLEHLGRFVASFFRNRQI